MTSLRSPGHKAGLPAWYNGYIHQFRTTSLPRTKKERQQLFSIMADEGNGEIDILTSSKIFFRCPVVVLCTSKCAYLGRFFVCLLFVLVGGFLNYWTRDAEFRNAVKWKLCFFIIIIGMFVHLVHVH